MNSLSIFIYLTQVCGYLGVAAVVAAAAIAAAFFLYTIIVGCHNDTAMADDQWAYPVARLKTWLFWLILTVTIAVVTPTQQTMLLIAASQIGEKVVTSEKFNQSLDPAVDLLNTWMIKEKKDILDSMNTPAKKD